MDVASAMEGLRIGGQQYNVEQQGLTHLPPEYIDNLTTVAITH